MGILETTRRIPDDSEAVPLRDAPTEECLVLLYGGDVGRRIPLLAEGVIGRDPENAIVLDLPDVSRQHARLIRQERGWRIADLGSTNGTDINGARISGEAVLQNGDLVRLGGVVLKYIAGGNIEALFHQEIYRASILDALTQVASRRHLLEVLEREVSRSRRYDRNLALAMIDIDHFKDLNDRHGHLTGDRLLQRIANRLSRGLRKEELLGRYGGEEFILIMPELRLDQAVSLCEKLRARVEADRFLLDGAEIGMTVSIGVATFFPSMSVEDLIGAADERLYRAKAEGRNLLVAG